MKGPLNIVDSIPDFTMEDDSNITAEKIEQTFLTCPVCFEVYDKPKCLPCLHTFCSHCLLSYIESKDMYGIRRLMGFPCPVCKQTVLIRDTQRPYKEWLDDIQNNFVIQNMIDCLASQHNEKTKEHDDAGADVGAVVPYAPSPFALLCDDNATPPPSLSPRPPTAPQPPKTPSERASDLLRTYSSQYGLTQRWASSPGSQHFNRPDFNRAASPPPATGSLRESGASEESQSNESISSSIMATSSVQSGANNLRQTYEMVARNWADYKPPKLSDVCCLPKHNGIIVLDYANRCVKYVKNVFMGRNVTTAMEVVGRPCSVALIDKTFESSIVVSVLNRNKLYFLRVPEFQLIDVMDTERPYRGVTVLSPTAILASSPGKSTCLDLIRIDHRCKMVSSQTIYQNQRQRNWNYDIRLPHYIAAVSTTSFMVSDARYNSLLFYDIQEDSRSAWAVKRFSLTLPQQYGPREVGGLCYHSRYVYLVDSNSEEVYKIAGDGSGQCVTILKPRHGIRRPASVCVGPLGEVCVVEWDGGVGIYKNQ